jgi:nucleoside-diphosphate-sugar epimerase
MSLARCEPAAGDRTLVLGATSIVGDYLLPLLLSGGLRVTALSRQPLTLARTVEGATWQVGDLSNAWSPAEDSPFVVHLAPLWLLPPLLAPLAGRGLRRLVAFGSTSVSARARSSNTADRELAERLARAEAEVARAARHHGVTWTVFRPTLIYGGDRDRSVAAMAAFALRFGFIPVAGQARGRRQPVRAEDLATACLAVLHCAPASNRSYDLPGGEMLTFHEMAERITLAVLGKRRVVRLPSSVLRGVIRAASRLPSFSHLTPEMADRMNEDLVYDDGDARRDFGWKPAPFDPSVKRTSC